MGYGIYLVVSFRLTTFGEFLKGKARDRLYYPILMLDSVPLVCIFLSDREV